MTNTDSACEWNPDLYRAALDTDPPHGSAVWSVGRGRDNIHLCDACAALPRFARRGRRPLRSPAPAAT